MVIEQYPHNLYVQKETEPVMLQNGDWTYEQPTWELAGRCREESSGKGQEVTASDLQTYKFSSLIQCPQGIQRIMEGTTIRVTESNGRIRIEGTCKKYDSNNLHCRIWV